VHFAGTPERVGELVSVRIDRATASAVYGEVVAEERA